MRERRNLFDGFGDLGADAVAGEESGADRSGSSGGEGEGPRVCKDATSEGSSQELRSHAFSPRALSHAQRRRNEETKIIIITNLETRLEARNVLSRRRQNRNMRLFG